MVEPTAPDGEAAVNAVAVALLMSAITLNFPNLTAKQREMLNSPARTLWVGAGTKTGKSAAAHAWIASGILQGHGCAWCGPWSSQTTKSYLKIKEILQPFIDAKLVSANDSKSQFKSRFNRGFFEPFTGENPQAIFGDGIKRFVIDEASRQTYDTFEAARTTTAATRGDIRVLFNVDHGSANWAVKKLLETKELEPEQLARKSVDYMQFTTFDGGIVDVDEIERARGDMSEVMWRALYLAEIPASDLVLFKNLAEIFRGQPAPAGPQTDHRYCAGIDVARKHDYTSISVFDVTDQKLVYRTRFNEISWTLQYARLKAIYDAWHCSCALVDETGLGDPILEELSKIGMRVEGYRFTEASRTALIHQGVTACDGKKFTVCLGADEGNVLRDQLEASHHQEDPKTGKIKYVLGRQYDDDAVSFLLAWHLNLQGGIGPARVERVERAESPYDGYM